MHLITPSLLNSFEYYRNYEAEPTEDDEGNIITAAEKESNQRKEFLQTLRREDFVKSEAMLKGIAFEDAVYYYCQGLLPNARQTDVIREIGDICMGGTWQPTMSRPLGEFILYARADVTKRDTIYDIKRTSSYEVGKYQNSAQHRIEFFCSGMPKFSYLVTDERSWWREDYFNHAGIEQEIREQIDNFVGYLKFDHEASEIFYERWVDGWKKPEVKAA